MDIRRFKIVAIAGVLSATLSAVPGDRAAAAAGPPSLAQAMPATAIPHDVPKAAAQAMQLALKWHGDAQMIDVRVRSSTNYALEITFKSPSERGFFFVQVVNDRVTSQAMPPVTTAATGDPLPLEFLDLPAALAKAEQQGMPPALKEASLQTSSGKNKSVVWAIQPETEDPPYLYTINAATAAAPVTGGLASSAPPSNGSGGQPARESSGSTNAPTGGNEPVMATGPLQKCLGITPGADKMARGPATQEFCQQLPGASLYDQAGARFQSGDHAGAAAIVRKAAEAGNAVAQLRLALMLDQGDGVPRSAREAFAWYVRAAAQGEPESLNQLGGYYELGGGLEENWDLAVRFWQASAMQGWVKGQFSLGRAYQFGIGVAQDRQQAIAWYRKAGAQGDPNGTHWATWLADATNNVGFRDDVERSIVMDVAGRMRFSGVLLGGDPYGVTFHNSGQRALWLAGQRERADKDEVETFRRIRQSEYEACRRAGRDNCVQ